MAQKESVEIIYQTTKPGTMKQASISKYGGPDVFEIQEIEIPEPKNDEILVEIKAAGVNWADAMRRAGTYFEHEPFPYVLGAEAAGVIVEVGPDVKNYNKGDRVLGFVGIGAYAQYIAKTESAFSPLPDGVSFAESTALLAQGLSGYLLLTDVAKSEGKTILIRKTSEIATKIY
ncbi:MAG: alcohol dehydrogenase catalytic domain-containing protein [Mucilaginibacter sp.]|nr:alcohol dehydrogenase catalytic domain-containing protein [Mucilaginibacter sp.]